MYRISKWLVFFRQPNAVIRLFGHTVPYAYGVEWLRSGMTLLDITMLRKTERVPLLSLLLLSGIQSNTLLLIDLLCLFSPLGVLAPLSEERKTIHFKICNEFSVNIDL